jgi:hypothetical protein
MRTILALCAAVLIGGSVLLYRHIRLPNSYGVFTGAQKAAVAELIARPQDYLRKAVAVEGIVREQCTTMGCYFFFHDGDKILRVDIQEIAMNAPRRNGRPVRVEGQMVKYGDGYQLYASAVEFE